MKAKVEEEVARSKGETDKLAGVDITYYTDPLCCWSWGMEPQWRRLRYEFGSAIRWRYCMGGLIPSWKVFHDSVNAVSRPAQMGPLWMEATHLTGMPIENVIWIINPPASSYLSCIAVKCAELQSPKAGEHYLRLLREALMVEGRNIAIQSQLVQVARDLTLKHPNLLDEKQFLQDLEQGRGQKAFAADLQEVRSRQITRFPTLIFRRMGYKPILISGHRTYSVLLNVMRQIGPELERKISIDEKEYRNYWGSMTERELEEIQGLQ